MREAFAARRRDPAGASSCPAALGVPRPVIDVTAVERLKRDSGPAKLRRFVPLAAEPALAATA
jgi:hypothetical protein